MEEKKMPEKMIVCLRKTGDQGKSGTIKALADLLMPDSTEVSKMPQANGDDICVALKVNGKRVGLCSGSYNPYDIEEHLEFLLKKGSEIIFCTCWVRGKTVKAVEKAARKYGHTIIWTAPYTDNTPPRKEPTPLQEKLNRIKAEHLKDFLNF